MNKPRIDFDKLRADHPLPDVIRSSGVDLIADGAEFRALCPFHGEKTPSFTVYRNASGAWKHHCFGCGAGGDVFDYVKEFYRLGTTGEAARYLSGDDVEARPVDRPVAVEAVDPYSGYVIGRPPTNAPEIRAGAKTPPILNPKRLVNGKPKSVTYQPTMVFPYRDKAGRLIGYVLRVEFDGRKITPGVWWTKNTDTGFEGWSHGSFPTPRPMYGLPEMYASPDHQVLLVEGEKCTDAARRVLAGRKIVPVSWMGGGKAISKTFWKSLDGRSIIIWPDSDAEGWRTAMGYADDGRWKDGLIDYAFAAGAERVKVVHVPRDQPDGWDIADAEEDGADIAAFIRERIQDWPRERFEAWKQARLAGDNKEANPDENRVRRAPEQDRAEIQAGNSSADRAPADAVLGGPADGEVARNNPPADTGAGLPATIGDGRRLGAYVPGWESEVIPNKDGDGLASWSTQNAFLFGKNHEKFRGTFAWNDFANEAYVMQPPAWGNCMDRDYPRRIDDGDISGLRRGLEGFGMKMRSSDMGAVIQDIAKVERFNPVKERFESMKWDGVPRLQGGMWEGESVVPWLAEYCGAADTEVNRLFGMKWMISAVARAFRPGCKVDTILILEGDQGMMKSTAFKVLADAIGPGLFTDDIGDPGSKDSVLQVQGKLIAEIAELTAISKVDVRRIKEWASRAIDMMRRPYGKTSEEFPRTCVYVGTVNPGGTGYLKDPTGARRFWPVKVSSKIDVARLKVDAEQLWAEAVHLYESKMSWWLTREESALADDVQRERYAGDPWAEIIDNYCKGKSEVRIIEIMAHLDIPKERMDHRVNARIADHLFYKEWDRKQKEGHVVYVKRGHDSDMLM